MKDVIEQIIDVMVEAGGMNTVKDILAQSAKAQKSVKGKGPQDYIDIPLGTIDLSANPITADSDVDPNNYFDNYEASEDNPITALELIQSTYDGMLSIIPTTGEGESTESFVNFDDEDEIIFDDKKAHEEHEKRIAQLWLKLKKKYA